MATPQDGDREKVSKSQSNEGSYFQNFTVSDLKNDLVNVLEVHTKLRIYLDKPYYERLKFKPINKSKIIFEEVS